MDFKIQTLPPHKRFRLMQQQQDDGAQLASFHLPAKKRKGSRGAFSEPTTAISLPAKKRVWAFPPPDHSPIKKNPSRFDLNLKYNPFSEEENQLKEDQISVDGSADSQSFETSTEKEVEEKEKSLCGCEVEEGSSYVYEDNQSIESTKEEKYLDGCGDNRSTEEAGEVEEEGTEEYDGIECAICQSTDADPSDPIVFCDGCDLMVHATCLGNPLIQGIPEGDWFCSQCLASQSGKKRKALSCCLCPVKGGALKPTNDGRWAHVVCALLVPEVFFEDPEGRDGIDCSKVPSRRWEQVCYLCNSAAGCVVDCAENNCSLAFHVTCGLKEELCIEYVEVNKKSTSAIVAGFCKSHTELWKKQQETGKYKIVARNNNTL